MFAGYLIGAYVWLESESAGWCFFGSFPLTVCVLKVGLCKFDLASMTYFW